MQTMSLVTPSFTAHVAFHIRAMRMYNSARQETIAPDPTQHHTATSTK